MTGVLLQFTSSIYRSLTYVCTRIVRSNCSVLPVILSTGEEMRVLEQKLTLILRVPLSSAM